MAIYQSFAAIYDQLFDAEMYDQWVHFSEKRLSHKRPVVLDLAGGAGRFATLMAARGWQMTDLDQSDEMLALASEHAAEKNVNVSLINGDMTALTGVGMFDAVTCYADSLNYLPTPADVSQTLHQVYQHLKDDGTFLFDVITPYQTDQVYPGFMFNEATDDDRAFLMWQSFADDDVEHGVIHQLDIFDQVADGHYDRHSETHFERAYPLEWWQQELTAAGFTGIKVTADFGKTEPTAETIRWFFECRRGGQVK